MKTLFRAGAGLAIAASLAAEAETQRPPPLPAGSWNVNWGEIRCSLIRQSETSPPSYFALQVIPGSLRSDLRVVSRDWPRRALDEPERLTISFHPQGWVVPGEIKVEDTDAGEAVIIYDAMEDARAAFEAAQSIRVARDGATLLEIPLPGSPQALTAFRECETTVMREWGINPAAHAAVRTPPQGNLAAFVMNDDYPLAAMRREAQGTVTFRLDLDATGRAVGCTLLVSSGDEHLDATSCNIMLQRARLEPGLGEDGNPIPATMVGRITWRILGG